MKEKQEISQVNFRCKSSVTDKLDFYAHRMGISRNQLMHNLIEMGLDDLKLLNSVGLLVVGRGLRDLIERVRRGEIKMNGKQGELEI